MKVYQAPYKDFFGPYQIADAIFFWHDSHPDEQLEKRWDYRLRDRLAEFLSQGFSKDPNHYSWLHRFLSWVNSKNRRKVKIRIDPYDTWNVDTTLSPIILPLLKQLKNTKHGSGFIDLEDVPEHLRYTDTEDWSFQKCFDFYKETEDKLECDVHTRYDWVLNEMIWTFEQLQPDYDWEEQYWRVHPEIDFTKHPEDEGQKLVPVRWKVKGDCDWDGRLKHQQRIDNGLKLFGKYYQTLWD